MPHFIRQQEAGKNQETFCHFLLKSDKYDELTNEVKRCINVN